MSPKKKFQVSASTSRRHAAPVALAPPKRGAVSIVMAIVGWLVFLAGIAAILFIIRVNDRRLKAEIAPLDYDYENHQRDYKTNLADLEKRLADYTDRSVPQAREQVKSLSDELSDKRRQVGPIERRAQDAREEAMLADSRVDLDAMAESAGLQSSELDYLRRQHQYLTGTRDQLQETADRLRRDALAKTEQVVEKTAPEPEKTTPDVNAQLHPPIDLRDIRVAVDPEDSRRIVEIDDAEDPTELRVTTEVIIENKSIKEDYENLKVVLVIIGKSTVNRRHYMLLSHRERTVSVAKGEKEKFELHMEPHQFLRAHTLDSYGADFEGYAVIVYDQFGREVIRKAHRSWSENIAPTLVSLDEGAMFDKDGKPVGAAD